MVTDAVIGCVGVYHTEYDPRRLDRTPQSHRPARAGQYRCM